MPAPRSLPRFYSTQGSSLPTFHQISAPPPPSVPLPPSHRLPSTGACLNLGPLRADAEVCPAQPPICSSGLQQLPSGPCPSTLCGPASPQASCSPPPTSSPCSWSDYISLQCNPITNCPVSLEVIPPWGTTSLPAGLLLKSRISHTGVECSPTPAAPFLLMGNVETEDVNLVTVTHPFRTDYKHSYFSYLTTSLLFAFLTKHQVKNRKKVETNANLSSIPPDFQGL